MTLLLALAACSGAEAPPPAASIAAAPRPPPRAPLPPRAPTPHPKTGGGPLVATLVELRISGARDASALAGPLRGALRAIADCYDRAAWVDVTLDVDPQGATGAVAVVDPEATGRCVHDVVANLTFDPKAGPAAGRARIAAGLRVGQVLDDADLPSLPAGKQLFKHPDGHCEAVDPPSCPPGVVCPQPKGDPIRCPTELGLAR